MNTPSRPLLETHTEYPFPLADGTTAWLWLPKGGLAADDAARLVEFLRVLPLDERSLIGNAICSEHGPQTGWTCSACYDEAVEAVS